MTFCATCDAVAQYDGRNDGAKDGESVTIYSFSCTNDACPNGGGTAWKFPSGREAKEGVR